MFKNQLSAERGGHRESPPPQHLQRSWLAKFWSVDPFSPSMHASPAAAFKLPTWHPWTHSWKQSAGEWEQVSPSTILIHRLCSQWVLLSGERNWQVASIMCGWHWVAKFQLISINHEWQTWEHKAASDGRPSPLWWPSHQGWCYVRRRLWAELGHSLASPLHSCSCQDRAFPAWSGAPNMKIL